jgi:chromosomal replication initiation ATPase DnaA
MALKLPDLASRLNIVPSIPILRPDDEMLEALIIKLFSDRQINISSEVLNYTLQNMERSFSYAEKLVSEADKISLSLKRAVTVPIIKQAMHELAHNTQQELF